MGIAQIEADKMIDYSNGYDFGFSHPEIKLNVCKNYMPSHCKDFTAWVRGVKDGRAATGLCRSPKRNRL